MFTRKSPNLSQTYTMLTSHCSTHLFMYQRQMKFVFVYWAGGQFVFVYIGQVAIYVCILWPGGNLFSYIVARWQYVFVSKVLPPRPFLPSSQQPGDRLRFPARSHSMFGFASIDFGFGTLSQLCQSLTKEVQNIAASSHPRISWIEHEGGVEVAIAGMAHNWSRQSVPF